MTDREKVFADLERARARMADFIRKQTGAAITEATLIREVIVIGGLPAEVEKCAAYFRDTLKIAEVTVDDLDPEDPEMNFARVPLAALETALRLAVLGAKR